ncbi:MAG: disulfide bond formation protein B [Pseudomonadota bacterium]
MHPSPTLSHRNWMLLLACWLVALVSTLGSLVFSEIMHLEPCVLCWYQRMAMFPLVLLLAQGLYTQDGQCVKYALPLALGGWLVAFYHCLLYGGFIPKGMQPCGKGASCAEQKLELAGFITIPLLSVAAFSFIAILLMLVKKSLSK